MNDHAVAQGSGAEGRIVTGPNAAITGFNIQRFRAMCHELGGFDG